MQPDIELLLSGFGVYLCPFVCPGLIACSSVPFYVVFSQVANMKQKRERNKGEQKKRNKGNIEKK